MGFREDQFRVTPGLYSGGGGATTPGRTNPPFPFTPSTVRVRTAPPDFNNVTPDQAERLIGSGATAVKVQRGFMRNLSTDFGSVGTKGAPTNYRLKFQFNPATIQQNVEARQDMYLSVLQDPTQLVQPVAASTAFSFELLFDRTHELMNGGVNADLRSLNGQTTTDNTSGDAADVGVMADLSVLYAIIGQGFDPTVMSAQYNIVRDNARREYERAIAQGDPNFTIAVAVPDEETDGTKTIFREKSTFDQYFTKFIEGTKFISNGGGGGNLNLGNSAFLVPTPVRIVFSALYMIDGYVMSSSVIFTKFNTNMVPTQCRVLLNINAVYIGFARDKTFVSEAIERSGNQAREDYKNAAKLFNNFCKSYSKFLKDYRVVLGGQVNKIAPKLFNDGGTPTNPDAVFYATKGSELYRSKDGVPDDLAVAREPSIASGFYNLGHQSSVALPDNMGYQTEKGISEYYDDGGSVKIDHKATVTVYGPYPDQKTAKSAKIDPNKKVGSYTQSKSAGSTGEWISNAGIKNGDMGSASIFNRDNSGNQAANAVDNNSFSTDAGYNQYANGYFKFVVDATVTVSTPDGQVSQSRTASQTQVFKGTDKVGGKEFKLAIPGCTEVQTQTGGRSPYQDSWERRGN